MRAVGRVDIAYAGGVALGLAVLLLLDVFSFREQRVTTNDFAFIWVGPAAVVAGADPYDAATWHATTARLGAGGARDSVYDYPAWTTLALLPLGLLPLPAAAAIWAYGGLALALGAVLLLARRYLGGAPMAALPVGYMLVASQPAVVNFSTGQWGLVLVTALVAVALGLGRGRDTLAAVGVLALLTKPTPFALAFPALLRAGAARERWRFVWIVIGGGVIAVAASLLVFRGWLGSYFELVQGTRLANPKTTVLPFALRELFGDVGLLIGVVALLALVALALRFHPRSEAYVPVWLAVAPLVTPYLHSYDQLVLLVPTTITIGALARRSVSLAYLFAAIAFVDLVVVAAALRDAPALALGRETLNGFVPAMLAPVVIAGLWRERRTVGLGP
jgi:hypothetical protein